MNLISERRFLKFKLKRLIVCLLLTEPVIIALLFAAFFGARHYSESLERKLSALEINLADERYIEPDSTAEAARNIHSKLSEFSSIETIFSNKGISIELAEYINESAPDGTDILRIEMSDKGILVAAYAKNLAVIRDHRNSLAESGSFDFIRQGSVRLSQDGTYYYELSSSKP